MRADYGPCWCDGEPSCGGRAIDHEYGRCAECRRLGHTTLEPLPFPMLGLTDTGHTSHSCECGHHWDDHMAVMGGCSVCSCKAHPPNQPTDAYVTVTRTTCHAGIEDFEGERCRECGINYYDWIGERA